MFVDKNNENPDNIPLKKQFIVDKICYLCIPTGRIETDAPPHTGNTNPVNPYS